jgi:hyperosmotically inducible periplasmic protein
MARRVLSVLCLVALVSTFFCASVLAAQTGRDLEISAAVTQALIRENPFENTHIDVKTFDGVVILGGHVDEYYKMQRVIEITRGIEGVKSVDNRINIWDRN